MKTLLLKLSYWLRPRRAGVHGFTLVELMIALGLFGLVSAGAISVYVMCHRIWNFTSWNMQTTRNASMTLGRLTYGSRGKPGLREASVSSTSLQTNAENWRLTVSNPSIGLLYFEYDADAKNIMMYPQTAVTDRVLIGKDIMPGPCPLITGKCIELTIVASHSHGLYEVCSTARTSIRMRN